MMKTTLSLSELWRALHILDDYVSGGFKRNHPTLEAGKPVEKHADPSAGQAADRSPIDKTLHAFTIADRLSLLEALAAEIAACVRCPLSANRTRTVPGEGVLDPPILLVGEGPGEDEDRTGRPFVGRAGQYLDTWLTPIGVERKNCFIANCVKCRPPQNREPRPEEISACAPYLERQIEVVRPRTILCLGRTAAQHLLGTTIGVSALRGRIHSRSGIPAIVTYHPSAVLRDQALRRPVWEDLKLLKTLL
jgi:DNA polymerase